MDSDSSQNDSKSPRKPRSANGLPISELRKEKRYEILSKRRWNSNTNADRIDLEKILDDISSGDPALQIAAVQAARKLPVNEDTRVIESMVPALVQCLRKRDIPELQRESAWTLKCLVSASHRVQAASYSRAVAVLAELLSSASGDVLDSVISALDSIASASDACRDLVVNLHVLPRLLPLVGSGTPQRTLLNVVRVFGHLCSEEYPPPPMSLVRTLTQPLGMLLECNDVEVLSETAWTLSSIAYFGPEYIQALFDSGIALRLPPLLGHDEEDIQMAALAAVGKILRGTTDQAGVVLSAGLLKHFPALLTHPDDDIRDDAEKILYHIALDHNELGELIDQDLMDALMELVQNASMSSESEGEVTEVDDADDASEWEDYSDDEDQIASGIV